jgi:hypothetical protein
MRSHVILGSKEPEEMSPFAKVQAISAIYFTDFEERLRDLEIATREYELWMAKAFQKKKWRKKLFGRIPRML